MTLIRVREADPGTPDAQKAAHELPGICIGKDRSPLGPDLIPDLARDLQDTLAASWSKSPAETFPKIDVLSGSLRHKTCASGRTTRKTLTCYYTVVRAKCFDVELSRGEDRFLRLCTRNMKDMPRGDGTAPKRKLSVFSRLFQIESKNIQMRGYSVPFGESRTL
jgi:hypothetical protein